MAKSENQKIKPYLVLQYLQRYSDENHPKTAYDICAYLEDDCGIEAERRSIYRDISMLNKALYMMRNGTTADEAEEAPEDAEEHAIVSCGKKGFYFNNREFDLTDLQILADCIYSTKFIDDTTSRRLIDVVNSLTSDYHAHDIKHDVFLIDRAKTTNPRAYLNVCSISDAMSRQLDGEPHTPEKIAFKYLKYDISDLSKPVERRRGADYTVSPFLLLIKDGNYYLVGYSDRFKSLRHYRVDRMKNIRRTGEPRNGEEEFSQVDVQNYAISNFSMFAGTPCFVKIKCTNDLLDTMIDHFGLQGATYKPVDDTHFTVEPRVVVDNPFFSWLFSFGKRAVLLAPKEAIEKFKAHISDTYSMY